MECSVVVCDAQAVMSAVAVPIGAEHIRVDVAYCEPHWPEYQEKFRSFGSINLVDITPINANRKPWMNDHIAEIDARWQRATPGPWKAAEQTHDEWVGIQDDFSALGSMVKPADADAVAHAHADIAYLLDALRHMIESWQTAENAIDAIVRVERRLEEMECVGPDTNPRHRQACPGCRRVDEIRAAIKGDG